MSPDIYHSENIFIVAGGPSAKGLDFSALKGLGYILGCKEAFFHAKADGCFTIDRRWNAYRLQRLKDMDAEVFASQKHWSSKASHNAPITPLPWDKVRMYKVWIDRPGLSNEPGVLNGKNSGFAALDFAAQCKPKRIFLFGFDMTMQPSGAEHWYKSPEWRPMKRTYNCASAWIPDFDIAAKQLKERGIEVYNVSKTSALTCFPKITFKEALKIANDL